MKLKVRFFTKILIVFGVLVSPMALFAKSAEILSLEREVAQLENLINERKQSLSASNAANADKVSELERKAKDGERQLSRIQRKSDRVQERLDFVTANIKDLDEWFNGLSAIEKGLNGSSYDGKMEAYESDKRSVNKELRGLNAEKAQVEGEMSAAAKELESLGGGAGVDVSRDTKIIDWEKQKSIKLKTIAKLNERAKKSAAPKSPKKESKPAHKAYVYVISGKQSGKIESTLRLKKWVESYDSKYIEANWNDLTAQDRSDTGSMIKFLSQMEAELKSIPKKSNLVIIGYGLGGGAAILAATEVAAKINRRVDYLVALDPMGAGNSRMNIVYKTDSGCYGPFVADIYLSCLESSERRAITKNVKNFYNRWQRESDIPVDAKDRIKVNKESRALSTGKFLLEGKDTKSNQKRVFFGSADSAHEMILSKTSSELPKLLVQYLR